jgi:FixJ family two-component response regulator
MRRREFITLPGGVRRPPWKINDEFMLDAVKNLVRSLGYKATVFSSAEDYLRSEHVRDSACVISDLQMPGMSGADLQDRLITAHDFYDSVFR